MVMLTHSRALSRLHGRCRRSTVRRPSNVSPTPKPRDEEMLCYPRCLLRYSGRQMSSRLGGTYQKRDQVRCSNKHQNSVHSSTRKNGVIEARRPTRSILRLRRHAGESEKVTRRRRVKQTVAEQNPKHAVA